MISYETTSQIWCNLWFMCRHGKHDKVIKFNILMIWPYFFTHSISVCTDIVNSISCHVFNHCFDSLGKHIYTFCTTSGNPVFVKMKFLNDWLVTRICKQYFQKSYISLLPFTFLVSQSWWMTKMSVRRILAYWHDL